MFYVTFFDISCEQTEQDIVLTSTTHNINDSQWKKSTDHPGFEPGTFGTLVWCSTNWANESDLEEPQYKQLFSEPFGVVEHAIYYFIMRMNENSCDSYAEYLFANVNNVVHRTNDVEIWCVFEIHWPIWLCIHLRW